MDTHARRNAVVCDHPVDQLEAVVRADGVLIDKVDEKEVLIFIERLDQRNVEMRVLQVVVERGFNDVTGR